MEQSKTEKVETKEDFCPACVAGLASLIGVGTVGGSGKAKNKTLQKALFWGGVAVSVVSIIVLIYLLCFAKCKKCR